MEEVWRDIPGYEGKYQASTEGNIRSLNRVMNVKHKSGTIFERSMRGRVLRPGRFCKAGHLSVVLGHGKAGSPVHQLVALTFLGPCPDGKEVLHKNGDPTDNRLVNLRYGTRTENILDVLRLGKAWRKLTMDDVRAIRAALAAGETGTSIARRMNVCASTVSGIKRGKSFSWLS